MSRRSGALAVAVLLLIGGTAAATRVLLRPAGHALVFDGSTETTKSEGYVGQSYTFGYPVMQVESGHSVHLRSFRLIDQPAGLVMDAAYAINACDSGSPGKIGSQTGDVTIVRPQIQVRAVAGVVVPAGQACWYVAVVVHSQQPGTYRIPAAQVEYSRGVRWRHYHQRIPHAVTLTTNQTGTDPRYCELLRQVGRACNSN